MIFRLVATACHSLDRAQVVFSMPAEISSFIRNECADD